MSVIVFILNIGYWFCRNHPKLKETAITFQTGDEVSTRDGRREIVLGSFWFKGLVLYRYSEPRKGYYVVKADFGSHIEEHLRNDLAGMQFRKL